MSGISDAAVRTIPFFRMGGLGSFLMLRVLVSAACRRPDIQESLVTYLCVRLRSRRACFMKDGDWVSVAEFTEWQSGRIVSDRLTAMGIQNRLVRDFANQFNPAGCGPCQIWVPPQSVDEAKHAFAEASVSEAQLEEEALKYPPPDDV